MSVNEVKLTKAKDAFVVRGSGPENNRTFCIGDEDHTIGNALRHVLMQHEHVGFAGYSVPHPSEPVVQIRVQTIALPYKQHHTTKGNHHPSDEETLINAAPAAVDILKESCQTLVDQCDIVLEKLETVCPETQQDRLELERKLMEFAAAEGEEEEEEEEHQMMQQDDANGDEMIVEE